jgi:hypothetical protein
MRLVHGDGARKVRGRNIDETLEVVGIRYKTLSGDGSTVISVLKDANVSQVTASTSYDNLELLSYKAAGAVSITNLTPAIVDIVNNKAVYKAAGVVILNISDGYSTVEVKDNIAYTPLTGTTPALISHIAGSLAASLISSVDALLVGKSASNYSHIERLVRGHDWLTNMVRNPTLWCAAVDTSGMAASCNTPDGWYQPNATAISPRHVLSCWHWVGGGNNPVFLGNDGVCYPRTVTNWLRIGNTDISIGLLDVALPASVVPVKTFPANITNYLPNTLLGGIPVCRLTTGSTTDNTQGKVLLDYARSAWPSFETTSTLYKSPLGLNASWFSGARRDYNSGSPSYAILGTTPILISAWFHVYDGPVVFNHITEINAAMATLLGASTYTIGTVDVSAYPIY